MCAEDSGTAASGAGADSSGGGQADPMKMSELDAEGGVVEGAPRRSLCNRTVYSYCLNVLVSLLLMVSLAFFIYMFKEYLKTILFWVDVQEPAVVFVLFMALFTLVSFPIAIGYLLLIITSGYLFGILKGLLTVVVSANFGVAVAHFTLKAMRRVLPLGCLLRNETARALLKVISGPQAIKIVFFARLTPIPFGLQNTIFAVSELKGVGYHLATFLGLFPAQLINVYLGSTLRSMEDVSELKGVGYHLATFLGLFPAQLINVYLGSTLRSMEDVLHESHVTGYIVFAFQITIGVLLMVWVVQKARKELTIAIMAAELGRDASTSSSSASIS